MTRSRLLLPLLTGSLLLLAMPAFAADAPQLDRGDTAWMLTSTALVLMMTVPGLALFYAGMVRKMNILNTMAQSFGVTCLVTVLWMVIGYSLAFTGERQLHRQPGPLLPPWHGHRLGEPAGADDPRKRLHVLPDDLRHHHPGADDRVGGGPDQVLRHHGLLRSLADLRLCAHRPYGLGRRVPGHARRARLRRRHGGAYQRRRRRAWSPASCSGPASAIARRPSIPTISASA